MFLCPHIRSYKHISGIQSICDRRNTVWDFTKVFNRGRRRIRTFWLGKISRSLNIHNPWSSVQLAKNFVYRVGISPCEINVYPMYIPIISSTVQYIFTNWDGAWFRGKTQGGEGSTHCWLIWCQIVHSEMVLDSLAKNAKIWSIFELFNPKAWLDLHV